jgi:hypothetical protein
MKHPIQPVIVDEHGTQRFKSNAIVEHLLDVAEKSGVDMNSLAVMDFTQEDREQFAQLIGYSLSGFSELSYASTETVETAYAMVDMGESELEARNGYLRSELDDLREALREPIARLFGKHPEDLLPE